MFGHLLIHRLKILLRSKEEMFWNLLFPIVLATFFYLAFGSAMERDETFQTVPVGIVIKEQKSPYEAVLDRLGEEGADKLLDIQKLEEKKAKEKLKNEKIDGIIRIVDGTLSLEVREEGLNTTILKSIVDQCLQYSKLFTSIGIEHPDKLAIAQAECNVSVIKNQETTLTGYAKQNPMNQYFYSLVAMVCMFGCYFGLEIVVSLQANLSSLAARRSITPTHRLKLLCADMLGAWIIHVCLILIGLGYMIGVLHIEFGERFPYMIGISLVGSMIGISMGAFVGSIGRLKKEAKEAIVTAVSLGTSFLAGLMVYDIPLILEKHMPIINRINPAKLVTDAFYSLAVYDTLDRYIVDMVSLVIIAGVLCIGSYCLIRRKTYASI